MDSGISAVSLNMNSSTIVNLISGALNSSLFTLYQIYFLYYISTNLKEKISEFYKKY